jgi:radical SAM superfamily enzyme YgiQ (UPF0313 family)
VQWRPHPGLEFYVDGQYNDYLYHQNYRFLNATDSRYAQNLTLTGFTIDEALANRNANGGTNDLPSGQRITGGTFRDRRSPPPGRRTPPLQDLHHCRRDEVASHQRARCQSRPVLRR